MRNFWATEGAGLVVRTCLKSPEVYEWMFNFASVMMSVGYSNGVRAVFAMHLKVKYPKEFKDFGKGDVNAGEQIKKRVERFRSRQMHFEFLEYLAENPGLSAEELQEIEIAAYRRLDGSYGGVVEVSLAIVGRTSEVPPVLESLPATEAGMEGEGSEPDQHPTSAMVTEAEAFMNEAEILTGVGQLGPGEYTRLRDAEVKQCIVCQCFNERGSV